MYHRKWRFVHTVDELFVRSGSCRLLLGKGWFMLDGTPIGLGYAHDGQIETAVGLGWTHFGQMEVTIG